MFAGRIIANNDFMSGYTSAHNATLSDDLRSTFPVHNTPRRSFIVKTEEAYESPSEK